MAAPDAPTPPEGGHPRAGRIRGALRRRPITWLLVTAAVALLLGAASGQSGTVAQADLDKSEQANAGLTRELRAAEAKARELTQARDAASRKADAAIAEARRITAKGKVPDLTGDDVDTARDNSVLDDFEWKVTERRQVSGASPGTVIAQNPAQGATLARGARISLVVAKKAPPKPRQWVTTYSISGAGAKRTDEFRIPSGEKVRVRYTFGGDSNDTLQLKQPDEGDDTFGDLIVNEIGPYTGISRLYGKSGTYYLDVSGGSWDIAVQVFKRP